MVFDASSVGKKKPESKPAPQKLPAAKPVSSEPRPRRMNLSRKHPKAE